MSLAIVLGIVFAFLGVLLLFLLFSDPGSNAQSTSLPQSQNNTPSSSSATSTSTAGTADTASTAGTSGTAPTASRAGTAGTAGTADTSGTASTPTTQSSATTAGTASTAATTDDPDPASQPTLVDCKMTAWSEWDECSKRCGGGTQKRVRSVHTQAANGGKACSGDTSESRACNTNACPKIQVQKKPQTTAAAAATTKGIATTTPDVFDRSCQKMANMFGVVSNKTWGTAPTWAQDWWRAKGKYKSRQSTDNGAKPCDHSDASQRVANSFTPVTSISGVMTHPVLGWVRIKNDAENAVRMNVSTVGYYKNNEGRYYYLMSGKETFNLTGSPNNTVSEIWIYNRV